MTVGTRFLQEYEKHLVMATGPGALWKCEIKGAPSNWVPSYLIFVKRGQLCVLSLTQTIIMFVLLQCLILHTPSVKYHVHTLRSAAAYETNFLCLSLYLFSADSCILSVIFFSKHPAHVLTNIKCGPSVHGKSERVVLIPRKLAHLLSACKNLSMF